MRKDDCSVIVVGAGLAGLSAATQLMTDGAKVTVIDARSRVGGRVFTVRDVFEQDQHAEAGGDFIDEEHQEIRRLAATYGLRLHRVVKKGFSFLRQGRPTNRRGQPVPSEQAWTRIADLAAPFVRDFTLAEQRWDGAIGRSLASRSVAQWLDELGADQDLRAMVRSLRGFFLADPEDLSLLVLIDQLASEAPGRQAMYRIEGGNDRLPHAMASVLKTALHLNTVAVAIRHDRSSVRLTVRDRSGEQAQFTSDYVIVTVPATTLNVIDMQPALPQEQAAAVSRLKYGRVTKSLLQFDRRFWRGNGRSRAYGTDRPIGAVWEANEEQQGRAGILTLMAGGQASEETQALLARQGVDSLVRSLDWLNPGPADLVKASSITWEDDPWARGGYAFFDPAYDPAWRAWLARPHGRILFAGEHTSIKWQGYMNGAVETGLRAAAEVWALRSRESRSRPATRASTRK
ncbi:MAG TPA: NAD(P)/FAD-dependent oxidoreductase [Nitrospira sp.]